VKAKKMIKSEVMKLREKHGVYYPPKMLFDIFGDNEDIPNDFLLACFKPKDPNRDLVIWGNEAFIAQFEKAMDDYFKEKNDNK
jgi:hypothetical protein